MSLKPIHRVRILNKDSEVFQIINLGDDKNNNLGIESITINKSKDDINSECIITINSKYDLMGVKNLGSDLLITNQLSFNDDPLSVSHDNKSRFKPFEYAIGDICYVELAYNENEPDQKEHYFGFIKQVSTIQRNKTVIVLQNHCYILKKIQYNFSQKKINVKELVEKLINDYNSKYATIYEYHLKSIKDQEFSALVKKFMKIEYNKSLFNPDYDIPNFRAQQTTALDILTFLNTSYMTKSNFIYLADGSTFYIGGFFNLLSVSDIEGIPSNLKDFFKRDFIYKNYDLYYESIGLNDNYIKEQIINKGNTLTNPVLSYVLESSLKWQNEADVIVKINFKIIDRDNKFTEKSFGDEGGEVKDVILFEEKTESQMKDMAEQYLKDYKFTGYARGSTIKVFGDNACDLFNNFYCVDVMQNQDQTAKQQYELVIQKYLPQSVLVEYSQSGGFKKTLSFGVLLSTNIKIENGKENNKIFIGEVAKS